MLLSNLLRGCLLLCCTAAALAQTTGSELSSGPPSGKYTFASTTPVTFGELVRGRSTAGPVQLEGHLFLPPGEAKVPAVILMHGSAGLYDAMLKFWPQQFNAVGIAVFSVDSFGPRGVRSTAEDQSQVPFAADVADAFAALQALSTHPRIDPQRIALMGFSRGGITTWRAAIERVIAAQSTNGLRFAAHVPVYSGGCTGVFRVQVKPGVFSKAPMLWIHGDADDYTPLAPCKEYAERIGQAGTPVEFLVLAAAGHKFDDDMRRIFVRGAQRSLPACPIEIDVDTLYAYDRNNGQRLQGPAFQEAAKACSALGAHVEGNRTARDQAGAAATAFLVKALKP